MMRFYDRDAELKILKKNRELSEKGSVFTVITGKRRIGKTALIRESEKNSKLLYFFAERGNENTLCEQLAADANMCLGMDLINTGRFRDLFKQLMIHGEKNGFTFVIDEFQELARSDGSVMSGIQRYWDEYKNGTSVNLIVCGSVHSMMIRIFENEKEPLFGRASSRLRIGPFRPSTVREVLRDHNPDHTNEDLLFLYMVTGGIPKYIELLMDRGAVSFDSMLDLVCSPGSQFLTDGKDLLISEFGKEYGTYFSILKHISKGRTTLRELNASIGKECGPYLENLEREYDIVKKNRPVFSKENSRDVTWKVTDNYLRFYFRYISSNQSLIEMGQYGLLKEKIMSDYHNYSGSVLEDYFREKMAEEERITRIGSYWDRKGMNEIDIIALNDMNGSATVVEVKRDPKKANIEKLKEKAGTVQGLNGLRTEYRILSLKDM